MIEWLKDACFYQVYPQSFMDSNGDGVGDFNGIISKLDYIRDIGFNAIWMNTCFDSPFMDAGYDIRNYLKTAIRYGTNEDLEKLMKECHNRGIHIILDLVPGHTSEEHEWFRESKKLERNEYSKRYIWTDSWKKYPKGLNAIVGRTERNGAYIVNFFSCEPALNYGFLKPTEPWQNSYLDPVCRETLEEIMNVMRFWLDRGCDGFRVDMSYSLVKNDDEKKTGTCAIWTKVRKMMNAEYPHAIILAEWDDPKISIPAGFHMDFMHHKEGNEVDTLFRDVASGAHLPLFKKNSNRTITGFLDEYLDKYNAIKDLGKYCFVSGNHDTKRLSRYLTIDEMKLAYAFIMTMPGAPFMYYGDEIGMRYIEHAPNKEGGYERCGSRTPMQWSHERNMGFSTTIATNLYLPLDESSDAPTVEDNLKNEDSLLNTVKKLLALRKRKEDLLDDTNLEFIYAWEDKRAFVYRRGSIVVFINPDKEIAKIPFADLIPQVDPNAETDKKKSHKSGSKDKSKAAAKTEEKKTVAENGVSKTAAKEEAKAEAKADTKPEDAIDTKTEEKAEAKVDTKPEAKAEVRVDTKPEIATDTKTEEKAEVKTDEIPEVKAETKVETKPEGMLDTKAEVNTEAKAEAKVDTKPESENAAKTDEVTAEKPVVPSIRPKPVNLNANIVVKESVKDYSKEVVKRASDNLPKTVKINDQRQDGGGDISKEACDNKSEVKADSTSEIRPEDNPNMKVIVVKEGKEEDVFKKGEELPKAEEEVKPTPRYATAIVKKAPVIGPVREIVIKADENKDNTQAKPSPDTVVAVTTADVKHSDETVNEEDFSGVKKDDKSEDAKSVHSDEIVTKNADAKDIDDKSSEVNPSETKISEASFETKPEEKKDDVTSLDTKTSDANLAKTEDKKEAVTSTDAKSTEATPTDAKSTEVTPTDAKPTEANTTDAKPSSARPEYKRSSIEIKKATITSAPIIPIVENNSKAEKKNSSKDKSKADSQKGDKKPERIPGINPKYRTDMKPLMIDIKSLWNAEQLFNINAMVIRNDIIEMDPQSVSIIDLSVKRDTRRVEEEEKKPGFIARFIGSVKRKEKKREKMSE